MPSVGVSAVCRRCIDTPTDYPAGEGPCIDRLRPVIEAVSQRNCTVLIQGESGSGKELLARHIHGAGPRRSKPFVAVDCTVLRDALFESQLFGHVKGAFTGAEQSTVGFFRAAGGGTLFLDEIGEMSLPVQAKLLRCIQDRAVVPLGGVDPIPIDVRILVATHRDLKAMVGRGEFRQDLYFRLNVVRILVPPLRERGPDILTLAAHFLAQFANLEGLPPKQLSPGAVQALEAYDWPGNVRELANVMERVHILSENDVVTVEDLPEELRSVVEEAVLETDSAVMPLADAERMMITRALRVTAGNQSRAAGMLQIDRRRLYRKVRQYGLASLVR
jgi:DNA-binding NtrC family response regulator